MEINRFDTPWKHAVIDNLLPDEDFQKVKDYVTSAYDFNKPIKKWYKEFHREESDTILAKILVPKIKEVFGLLFDELNYSGRIVPAETKPFIQFYVLPEGMRHVIHPDRDWRVMVCVLYVHPEENNGTETYLSNNPNSFCDRVEWKPNRAFCFVPQEHEGEFPVSWHNFGNDAEKRTGPRATINLLMATRFDKDY